MPTRFVKRRPGEMTENRLLGADFARAAACLIVLFHHLAQRLSGGEILPALQVFRTFANNGTFGVGIFFVLSGFLLARPFWQALDKRQPMPSLRIYAMRRAARILPGFWLALTVTFVCNHRDLRRAPRWRAVAALLSRLPARGRLALADVLSGRGERAALVDRFRGNILCAAAARLRLAVPEHAAGLAGGRASCGSASLRWRCVGHWLIVNYYPDRFGAPRLGVRPGGWRQNLGAALQPARLLRHVRDRQPGGWTAGALGKTPQPDLRSSGACWPRPLRLGVRSLCRCTRRQRLSAGSTFPTTFHGWCWR